MTLLVMRIYDLSTPGLEKYQRDDILMMVECDVYHFSLQVFNQVEIWRQIKRRLSISDPMPCGCGLKSSTPTRTEIFNHRIKLISQKKFVLICHDFLFKGRHVRKVTQTLVFHFFLNVFNSSPVCSAFRAVLLVNYKIKIRHCVCVREGFITQLFELYFSDLPHNMSVLNCLNQMLKVDHYF